MGRLTVPFLLAVAILSIAICYVPQLDLRNRHPVLTARLLGVATALLIFTILAWIVAASGH